MEAGRGEVEGGTRAAEIEELRAALALTPPQIPCKFLYDERGSALFELITRQPEYYPTRTERDLLRSEAHAIVGAAGRVERVIELGSGGSSKVVPLLHAILGAGRKPRFLAVDISPRALERIRERLADEPGVEVELLCADFSRGLALPAHARGGARMVALLGGTLGNDEDAEAIALFSSLRAQLAPGDSLLIGANLLADPAMIEAAYNDAAGVTAAFNKNALLAVNALAGSRFDPADFAHRAFWNPIARRIEMWLVAERDLEIDLGAIGGLLRLPRGQGLRTEISRRFTREELESLLLRSGFMPAGWFESDDGRVALALGKVESLH